MKGENRKYIRDVDHVGYNTKKITADYNSFEKVNPIKGLLYSPCQKCMDKFSCPYF